MEREREPEFNQEQEKGIILDNNGESPRGGDNRWRPTMMSLADTKVRWQTKITEYWPTTSNQRNNRREWITNISSIRSQWRPTIAGCQGTTRNDVAHQSWLLPPLEARGSSLWLLRFAWDILYPWQPRQKKILLDISTNPSRGEGRRIIVDIPWNSRGSALPPPKTEQSGYNVGMLVYEFLRTCSAFHKKTHRTLPQPFFTTADDHSPEWLSALKNHEQPWITINGDHHLAPFMVNHGDKAPLVFGLWLLNHHEPPLDNIKHHSIMKQT